VATVEETDDDTVNKARDVLETLADEFHDLTLDD